MQLTDEEIDEIIRLGGKEITYVSEKTGINFRVWVSPERELTQAQKDHMALGYKAGTMNSRCPYCKSELSKIGYMCDCYRPQKSPNP
jgi:hypothetical protein